MRAYTLMMQQQKQAVTDIIIEQTGLESIIDIRHAILRAGQQRNSCYYLEDSYKHTIHFSAKSDGQIIACASVYKETHPDFSLRQSWRIRGMAVLELFQNQNIGSELLCACVNHAISHKGEVIWCNARIDAVKFYKKGGFKIIGDEFDLPDIGPHFLLAKNLGIYFSELKFLQIAKKIFAREQPEPIPQSRQQS